jgi:hypothetical protein
MNGLFLSEVMSHETYNLSHAGGANPPNFLVSRDNNPRPKRIRVQSNSSTVLLISCEQIPRSTRSEERKGFGLEEIGRQSETGISELRSEVIVA